MRIDGHESEEERELVSRTAMYLGLEKSEYVKLLETPVEYSPPKSEPARIVQFYQMSVLVRADGRTEESEVKYLKWLGLRMGLREEAVEAVLIRLTNYPIEILDPEVIIDVFQLYHN